jgi:hypothetical protein
MRIVRAAVVVGFACAVGPSAWAQSATTGAIAGATKDTTGAVLPGVTVEASSPALIEKVRSVVTDAQGNYKIVDLRPGTYAVTFTLPGFSTFKREGIELTTGFTATANAEMTVGSLEETVTVTGASPVVDIQNVRQQRVLTREVLDSLPTNRTLQGFSALTLGTTGASKDVGGNTGDGVSGFGFQGSHASDQRLTMEGMLFTGLGGSANMRNIVVNQAFVQETTLETRGAGAENESSGPHINIVPKDGGNQFSGSFIGNLTGKGLQSTNYSDELEARGLPPQPAAVKKIYDFGGGFGGPIKRDRLWFYTAIRHWGTQNNVAGPIYWNKNQGHYLGDANSGFTLYEPDLSRGPAFNDLYNRDYSVRLTWQVTEKNKLAMSQSVQSNCNCNMGNGPNAPEAWGSPRYWPISLTQVSWSSPHTSRLLFEGGVTGLYNDFSRLPPDGVTRADVAIQDLSTGRQYNSRIIGQASSALFPGLWLNDWGYHNLTNQLNGRFNVNYVTGSHAVKVGFTLLEGWQQFNLDTGDKGMQYQIRNGAPVSLTEWDSPFESRFRFHPNFGSYAQDQWTIRRVTLNAGVRFDWLHGQAQAHTIPAGPLVPVRDLPALDDAPNWKDVVPRLGVAWDVFGDGKTAVKGNIGKYVSLASIWGLTYNMSPAASIAQSSARTWGDINGNYVPDCDLKNQAANGECGAGSNALFGQFAPSTRFSDDVTDGWGVRDYSWQVTGSIQHELRPNVAVSAGYYHNWYGGFQVVDNTAVTSSDYSPFCVTVPTDDRLGAVSGTQACGLYDINPNKLGQVNNLVHRMDDFGTQREVYDGFDASLNARLARGAFVAGGVSSGRTLFDNCVVYDSPQAGRPDFCKFTLPFKGQTQYKANFLVPIVWDIRVSGLFQNLPGIADNANLNYTNAQIAPSLGRNLAAGANGTVTVALLPPNTKFEHRLSQFDLRLSKMFRAGRMRIQGMFDVYNAFNAATIIGVNNTYGAAWLTPTNVLGGRLLKFGTQIDF